MSLKQTLTQEPKRKCEILYIPRVSSFKFKIITKAQPTSQSFAPSIWLHVPVPVAAQSKRLRSTAARLLRMWVRIPPGAWMSVCCECCVLSGRGLCDELIMHPEESFRLWCVVVCDLETSRMRRPWPALDRSATEKKYIYIYIYIYIYDYMFGALYSVASFPKKLGFLCGLTSDICSFFYPCWVH